MPIRVLSFLALLLLAAPAHANTIYSYVGDTFHYVEGSYTTAERLTGSFTMRDGFLPATPFNFDPNTWRTGVVGWSFTDGHQTLTDENSTSGRIMWFGTGARDETFWIIDFSNALGAITTIRFGDFGDTGVLADGSGRGRNQTMLPFGGVYGNWTVQHVEVPELAIIHLPRLLKFGLGLGLEAAITMRLQHATARLAAIILGAPRDGVFIEMPNVRVEVAEACSGIATLALMLVVATLIAVTLPHDRWPFAIVLVLLAGFLALEANALRVVGVAIGLDQTAGTMARAWKDWIQYGTTAIALGQLVGLARIANRR